MRRCELIAMSKEEVTPVSVVALRAEDYSPDGNSIVVSLRAKFSTAERKYLVPINCFYDLIIDLQRLNANRRVEPLIQPEEVPTPAE